MGRLGADFTAQLPPFFETKMHSLVVRHWKEGVSQLAETLKICRDAGVASPLTSTAIMASSTGPLDTPGGGGEGGGDTTTANSGPLPPPRQLMALPPLGRLVNAVLTGLNELRRCLLPGIFAKLRDSLEEVLKDVDTILQSNERAVMTPGLRGDAVQLREIAKEMKQVMTSMVVPYVRGALEASLGNEEAAKEFHEQLKPAPQEETKEEAVDDAIEEEEEKDAADEADNNKGNENEEVEKADDGWDNNDIAGLDETPANEGSATEPYE
jgi:hypothetical protein